MAARFSRNSLRTISYLVPRPAGIFYLFVCFIPCSFVLLPHTFNIYNTLHKLITILKQLTNLQHYILQTYSTTLLF